MFTQTECAIYTFSKVFWLVVFLKRNVNENTRQREETATANSNCDNKFKQSCRYFFADLDKFFNVKVMHCIPLWCSGYCSPPRCEAWLSACLIPARIILGFEMINVSRVAGNKTNALLFPNHAINNPSSLSIFKI